jgi:Cellulase (glycosyl hydrolase family 5)
VPGSPSLEFSKGLTLLSSLSGPQRRQQVASRISGLRLMNYYPAADPWTKMWTNWNPGVLHDDFARIHSLGANAVRITVFPGVFGWPNISHLMAVRFADTLNIAASSNLGVQVTLFDWWGSYEEITQSQKWLKAFLGPYASDPEIQLVELKNEVNPSDPTEIAWARALLDTLRSVMPRTPSTTSVTGAEGPAGWVQLRIELADAPLDVADLHFYGEEVVAYSWMLAAKNAAGSLPLFVGEIGSPGADNGVGDTEAAALRQAHWFSVVFAAARAAGVSTPAPWTLYDFKPGSIPKTEQDPSAYNYGLYSAEGQWRPSVWVVREAFAGRRE